MISSGRQLTPCHAHGLLTSATDPMTPSIDIKAIVFILMLPALASYLYTYLAIYADHHTSILEISKVNVLQKLQNSGDEWLSSFAKVSSDLT